MGITEVLAAYCTQFIEWLGYPGVAVLMTLESMIFPVPSEAVMPFAGFLIIEQVFTLEGVIFWSTVGSIAGSSLSYAIGYFGGKPFIERYGKYFFLNTHHLAFTEKFFQKYGIITVFLSRFIPVVRHFISIPAGLGRMRFFPFIIFTIIGAGLWNAFLTVVGMETKQNWEVVMSYSHVVDLIIVACIAGACAFFVYSQMKKRRG